MGTLDTAAECLLQMTQVGLGAVQAGGQMVVTLWGHSQARYTLAGRLPLYLEQLQVHMKQLRNELDREYSRGHNPAPDPGLTPGPLGLQTCSHTTILVREAV